MSARDDAVNDLVRGLPGADAQFERLGCPLPHETHTARLISSFKLRALRCAEQWRRPNQALVNFHDVEVFTHNLRLNRTWVHADYL